MVEFYDQMLYLCLAVCGLLMWPNRDHSTGTTNSSASQNRDFRRFKAQYLSVYLLMVAGDWLQGAHIYSLYSAYDFPKRDIALLFVAGYGSSMTLGTWIGSLADSLGRKKFGMLYCITYIASCATKHFKSFWVLLLGRILGGISASLLFSVFESWLVCEHHAHGFHADLLGEVFALQTFGTGLVAVISGIVAQVASDSMPLTLIDSDEELYFGGYVTSFDVAALVLGLGGVIMACLWKENYGSTTGATNHEASIFSVQTLKEGLEVVRGDQILLHTGLIQSLMEGSMHCFIFEWTPALTATSSSSGENPPPYGTIFACMMVCSMIGSQLLEPSLNYLSMGRSPHLVLPYVLIISSLSLTLPLVDDYFGTTLSFFGFLVFEICIGLYLPLMSMMKSTLVAEDKRSTLYNIFRIPMNGIVLFVLIFLHEDTFAVCILLLSIAGMLQARLIHLVELSKSANQV